MRRFALLLAAAMVTALAMMGGALPAKAEVNPYITEGRHTVNGRQWRTTCEPYSQTTRCRAEIWSTQVRQVNGKFVSKNQWAFNNLTYLESPRALWKGNPLGFTNRWTATDGRRWYTECDTPATGRNGCRSYAEARVIQATRKGGVWTYAWVTKYVFNNIVNFNVPKPPAKPVVTMPDKNLKACINLELGKPRGADITLAVASTVDFLDCRRESIRDLRGLDRFTNLTFLNLNGSQVSDLAPLKGLKKLDYLDLTGNAISDVTPLANLTALDHLVLAGNQISDVSPLRSLTKLTGLELGSNQLKDLTPLSSLNRLTWLDVSSNQLTSLTGTSTLKELTSFYASDNDIVDIGVLATFTKLEVLSLDQNRISDISPLQGLGKLHFLDLSNNEITHVVALAKLPLTPSTSSLVIHLWNNPIQDQASLDPLIARGNVYVHFDEP